VNTVMNIRVPEDVTDILISWPPVSF
jgi:hypothetical protein